MQIRHVLTETPQ